ncbi:MAG: asparagine synthase-related protein [Halioglobus sp.]
MSGFIAIINTDGSPVDEGLLSALTDSLAVRGPDQQKVWAEGAVGLGHTLFRTTHEAQYENQPASLGGNVWITGCIRVDGRKALLRKLKLDIALDKTPDSELVLHAYRAWGESCLEQLLGDFAFVIWDGPRQKLFCARDRFGMRQLYHARTPQGYVVSNSLATMRQHPAVSSTLNDQAIGDFLLLGDHIWTDKTQTAFEDVKTLPPSHQMTITATGTDIRQYWDVPVDVPLLRYRNPQDYVDHFHAVFTEAVEDRLRTDKVVITLSGGMDSSAIAATATEIQRRSQSGLSLQAVTAVYDELHPCEEEYYSGLVAEHLKLPIHYVRADNYPFLDNAACWTRPLALYQPGLWVAIDQAAMQHGRVMLTGSAGDNLLHYTPPFSARDSVNPFHTLPQLIRMARQYGKVPPLGTGLMAKLNALRGRENKTLLPYPPWINPELEEQLQLKKRWQKYCDLSSSSTHPRHPWLQEALVDPDWNTDDMQADNQAALTEQRDPFMDLRLVKFVLSLRSLPWLYKKHILRQSMKHRLPEIITQRPKTPLGDISHSLANRLGPDQAQGFVANPDLSRYVNEAKCRDLLKSKNNTAGSYMTLRPLVLNHWLDGRIRAL